MKKEKVLLTYKKAIEEVIQGLGQLMSFPCEDEELREAILGNYEAAKTAAEEFQTKQEDIRHEFLEFDKETNAPKKTEQNQYVFANQAMYNKCRDALKELVKERVSVEFSILSRPKVAKIVGPGNWNMNFDHALGKLMDGRPVEKTEKDLGLVKALSSV